MEGSQARVGTCGSLSTRLGGEWGEELLLGEVGDDWVDLQTQEAERRGQAKKGVGARLPFTARIN